MPQDQEILVTGGAGFIGSYLVERLVGTNDVTVVDDLSTGIADQVPDAATFVQGDVRDREALADAVDDPDVVYHLAADAHTRATSAGWDDPVHDAGVNAVGTLTLMEVLREADLDPTVVFASSAAVYGDATTVPIPEDHPLRPISPYGVHKATGEHYMGMYHRELGYDAVSARIFNTYGPRQPRYVMYDFLKKLQRDNDHLEVLGTGRQIRDYCYVTDTVEALVLLAEDGAPGEAYNLSGEDVVTIGDLAETIVDLVGVDAEITTTETSWTGDPDHLEADISRIRDLGFSAKVPLEEGLQRLVDYFVEREGPIKT